MKKKQLSIISVLFVMPILVAGCSPAENISPTPIPTFTQIAAATNTSISSINLPASPTRLVGHWEAPYDWGGGEIYLGELNSDGKGKLYRTFDSETFCERTYEVLAEDEDSYTVRFYRGYTPKYEDYSFQFMDDGFTLSYAGEFLAEYTYVDSETEPENLSTLVEKEAEYLTTTSLTGHWSQKIPDADENSEETMHVYFGKINEDGEGIYYMSYISGISGENADTYKYTFKIVNEDGRDYDLILKNECGGDDIPERWEVSEDGQNLNLIREDGIFRHKYIDSNTEP